MSHSVTLPYVCVTYNGIRIMRKRHPLREVSRKIRSQYILVSVYRDEILGLIKYRIEHKSV